LWLIEDRNIILQEIVANFTINKEIKETTINYITQRFGNFFMQLGINNKTRLEGENYREYSKFCTKNTLTSEIIQGYNNCYTTFTYCK
jgi:hypothetical protein